ncbi:unnamed protein product, partial [Nesidiocoris tenuis]
MGVRNAAHRARIVSSLVALKEKYNKDIYLLTYFRTNISPYPYDKVRYDGADQQYVIYNYSCVVQTAYHHTPSCAVQLGFTSAMMSPVVYIEKGSDPLAKTDSVSANSGQTFRTVTATVWRRWSGTGVHRKTLRKIRAAHPRFGRGSGGRGKAVLPPARVTPVSHPPVRMFANKPPASLKTATVGSENGRTDSSSGYRAAGGRALRLPVRGHSTLQCCAAPPTARSRSPWTPPVPSIPDRWIRDLTMSQHLDSVAGRRFELSLPKRTSPRRGGHRPPDKFDNRILLGRRLEPWWAVPAVAIASRIGRVPHDAAAPRSRRSAVANGQILFFLSFIAGHLQTRESCRIVSCSCKPGHLQNAKFFKK